MIIYLNKFFDFVKSSIFYAPLKCGKSHWNRRHFGSRPCFQGQGSGDYSDVTSRTQQSVFRVISYSSLVYVWKVRSLLVANSRNPHRYVVGSCSNVISSENGIALHTIPFYGKRWTSRSKETKEKMDRFCKTETKETCWMGPIEELGYMLEAF